MNGGSDQQRSQLVMLRAKLHEIRDLCNRCDDKFVQTTVQELARKIRAIIDRPEKYASDRED